MKLPTGDSYFNIKSVLRESNLYTVCEEANCPNISECWEGGTATFMLLGDSCTRGCRFCNVKTGNPKGLVDENESEKIAGVISKLGLRYAVLTAVARDDLADGGASHFAKTIDAIHNLDPSILVEALIPDFSNDLDSLKIVVDSLPAVIAHNIETTRSLTSKVRDPRAGYHQSLSVLRNVKKFNRNLFTKSSIMLGLGETDEEVLNTMKDLRDSDVDMLTIGQYMQPSTLHLDVIEYVKPERFKELQEIGESMGFIYVAAGPLVRSSYRAGELFVEKIIKKRHDWRVR